MKRTRVKLANGFKVVLGNRRSQAAEMVLRSGDKEGDPRNRHRGADQLVGSPALVAILAQFQRPARLRGG